MTRAFPLTYQGFAYRQTESPEAPWLVLFVASAEEILSWAGIPRRTESATMGFQRVDNDDRVQRTKSFFNLPPNQSPTALIVGVHPPRPDTERDIELRFLAKPSPDLPCVPCELVVRTDTAALPLSAAATRVKQQLQVRLSQESPPPAENGNEEAGEISAEEAENSSLNEADEEDEEESEEGGGDDGFELTPSLLHKVLHQLDDPAWVEQNKESILDLAKPATIIDGQHRIKGAALCERDIPFAVCALIDCTWPEQVFQFTVVNYSAEGIPDQFITANAALSLTESELNSLQTRLVQAQVKVIEYELMRFVQFDAESPFFNMVNLSESKDQTKIGYKTMVRVAKDWYSANASVLKSSVLPALFPMIKGRAHRQRLQLWKDDLWGSFFIDFWKVVRDHYQSHRLPSGNSLWTVGDKSNLMIAIVLFEFQKMFFVDLNSQDDEFFQVPPSEADPIAYVRAKLRQRANKFVTFFPAEFFAAHWEIKSLNISAGRKALQTALQKLLQSKGKYQYGKSPLVTGETG